MSEKYWVDGHIDFETLPTPPEQIADNAGVPVQDILRMTPVFDLLIYEQGAGDVLPLKRRHAHVSRITHKRLN